MLQPALKTEVKSLLSFFKESIHTNMTILILAVCVINIAEPIISVLVLWTKIKRHGKRDFCLVVSVLASL